MRVLRSAWFSSSACSMSACASEHTCTAAVRVAPLPARMVDGSGEGGNDGRAYGRHSVLDRRKETRKRGIAFHAPVMVPLSPHIRIVQDDPAYVSLVRSDRAQRREKQEGGG